MIIFNDAYPFGACNNCNYEFDSYLLNEYEFEHCPKCGTALGKEEWARGNSDKPEDGIMPGSPNGSKCDRCGVEMRNWQMAHEGKPEYRGGNCTVCGRDLCSDCAGTWGENGECESCRNTHAQSGGRKDDTNKLRWDLLPWEQVEEVVKVLSFGAKKYAPDNWKKVEPLCERYSAALMRHFVEWEKGNYFDTEAKQSGISLRHMAQVACNALFLLWVEMTGGEK